MAIAVIEGDAQTRRYRCYQVLFIVGLIEKRPGILQQHLPAIRC